MSKEKEIKYKYSGLGLIDALFLLFLGLKLGGVITWSWWWVFSPIWIPVLFIIILLIGLGIITMITTLCSYFFP